MGARDRTGANQSSLKSGIDFANFDKSIKPGDNFFQYVNGKWIKDNPIPAEQSRWARSRSCKTITCWRCARLLKDWRPPRDRSTTTHENLARLLQDRDGREEVERTKAKPLAEDFDRIAKIKNPNDLVKLAGEFEAEGLPGIFGFGVDQDEKHSSQYAIQLWQGGLGLPTANII